MAKAEAAEYFKAYEDYSKTLRTWLVAYGIGGPVLFLTNERISQTVLQAGNPRLIAGLFLAGVILQVLLAAINKTAMWICYYSHDKEDDQEEEDSDPWWCELAHWVSKQFWLDLTFDTASLAAFTIATWHAFNVLVKA